MDDELIKLGRIRTMLEKQQVANPDDWDNLASQYEDIGARANAAVCRERARHYRHMQSMARAWDSMVGR